MPVGNADESALADAAQLSSLADETPEGRSIVVLAKEKYGLRERAKGELSHATWIEFTAQTRMSGVDLAEGNEGRSLRKGAATNAVQLAELLHERGLLTPDGAPSPA